MLLFVIACSSTKIVKHSALPKIVAGEGIVLMDIHNLSEAHGYKLFESMKQIMSRTNEIKFLAEQEHHLIQRGISKNDLHNDQIPDSLSLIIASKINCRYILNVKVLKSKRGGTFGSYTSLELDHYNKHYYDEKEANSASLMFELIDCKSDITKERFQVTTKINPLTINESEGETRVNATTEFSAIRKAFEKGVKQLRKGIISEANRIDIYKQ